MIVEALLSFLAGTAIAVAFRYWVLCRKAQIELERWKRDDWNKAIMAIEELKRAYLTDTPCDTEEAGKTLDT